MYMYNLQIINANNIWIAAHMDNNYIFQNKLFFLYIITERILLNPLVAM